MTRTARLAALVVPAAFLFALGGCGSSTPIPTVPGAPVVPAASEGSGDRDASCPPAAIKNLKEGIGALDGVKGVEIVGQCTRVVVSTAFKAKDSAKAKALCDDASTLVYGFEVGSVSVEGADATELAMGIKGAPCRAA
ncbi:hypothetical protein [Actinokineospora sp. NBRC 105648]|uniref:hypothetical protein n=1 Tax=Actinokineospora sp. NBRC 105648 TaxID=3032206 RepID=UPI0024A26D48|nr:hypothetical protein [Actinokineospora sp. NBRC 105648]GLZ40213.1 hypothetical protein Acsp05_38370 [Actinokineospora sp. NBRC 105648]